MQSIIEELYYGNVLPFEREFQKEVFEKHLATYSLSKEDIIEMFSDDDKVEEFEDEYERCFEDDMSVMGIVVEDDEIEFLDKTEWENNDNGIELYELIEELGWECNFEGESWKFETSGVYFL